MRILIATDHFPPYIGGAHRQTHLLAREMASRGHVVAVAAPLQGGLPKLEHGEGFVVHRVRQMRTAFDFMIRHRRQRHQPPFPDPVTVAGLHFLIADFEPDVVHAYGWLAFSVAAAMGRKRIPLLVSARDYGYFCTTRTLLRKGTTPCSGPAPIKCLDCAGDYYGVPKGWLAAVGVAISRPLLVRRMTALHSVSAYVNEMSRRFMLAGGARDRRDLPEYTIPSFQANFQTPLGVEETDFDAWMARLPDEPFILYVGAFRKVKGLETLFDAYRRLDSPPPLVMIGTFERDSPRHFPPAAVILPNAPHEVVMAAWDRAMFGVMPSLWPEPLGAVVAEAMSRGRPVIGTALGGHSDMLDAGSGILVPQGDAAALAGAMRELIESPEYRERLGRAAAERAKAFAAPKVVPRFEEAYLTTSSMSDRHA